MKTLAIVNLKGGVGKNVSAENMAHILATVHHKKVLLVDADKQGNASRYFHLYGEHDGTAALDAERETTGTEEDGPPSPLPPTENVYVRTEPTKLTPVPPDGEIVDFPAPPSPPPAEDTPRPEKEPMHKRMAANILEDLQMYCEEMLDIEAGLADTRADALAVAIAVLRK